MSQILGRLIQLILPAGKCLYCARGIARVMANFQTAATFFTNYILSCSLRAVCRLVVEFRVLKGKRVILETSGLQGGEEK